MSFTTSCQQCDAKFEIQDQHVGRKFRCKECGAICKAEKPDVKTESKPTKKPTPSSSESNQRKPRPETPTRPRKKAAPKDEFDDVEVVEKQSSRGSYDEYEEPEDYEEYEEYEDYEDDYQARKPRRSRSKPSRKKGKSVSVGERFKGLGSLFHSPLFVWSLPFVGGISSPVLAYIHPYLGLIVAAPMVVVGLVLMGYGSVRSIMVPFEEDSTVGFLYLFLPFYSLYHIVTRFDEHLPAILSSLLGGLFLGGGVIGLIASGASAVVNKI